MEAAVNLYGNYPDGAWADPEAPWNAEPQEARTCGECAHYDEAPAEWSRVPFGRCHPMCCWSRATDEACETDFEERR